MFFQAELNCSPALSEKDFQGLIADQLIGKMIQDKKILKWLP